MIKKAIIYFLIAFMLGAAAYAAACMRTVKAKAGNSFSIKIESNPTTGYSWQLASPVYGKLVRHVSNKYYPAKTGLVGSGGVEIWTFKAIKRGNTRIKFKYVRPWEKGIAPVSMRDICVKVY